MRNPDGTVQHNAHLLGFFRRLCKLLYMKIRPVIVFDGAPPMLKKNTLKNRNKKKLTGQVIFCPRKSRQTNRCTTLIALARRFYFGLKPFHFGLNSDKRYSDKRYAMLSDCGHLFQVQIRKIAQKLLLNQLRAHQLAAESGGGGGSKGEADGSRGRAGPGAADGGTKTFDFSNPNKARTAQTEAAASGAGQDTGRDEAAGSRQAGDDEMEEVDGEKLDEAREGGAAASADGDDARQGGDSEGGGGHRRRVRQLRDDDYSDGEYAAGQNSGARGERSRRRPASGDVRQTGGDDSMEEDEESEGEKEIAQKFGRREAVSQSQFTVWCQGGVQSGADYEPN